MDTDFETKWLDLGIKFSLPLSISCAIASLILISLKVPSIAVSPIIFIGVISFLSYKVICHVKNKIIDNSIRLKCSNMEHEIEVLIEDIYDEIDFNTINGKNLRNKVDEVLKYVEQLSKDKETYGGERLYFYVKLELDNIYSELRN